MDMVTQYPAVVAIAAYWVFSALVGGMPTPTSSSSAGYQWLHDSLHILAGNLSAAVVAKYPQLQVPAGTDIKQTTSIHTPND